MVDPEQIIGVARSLSVHVQEVLPPCAILAQCRKRSQANTRLTRHVIGHSAQGTEVEAYRIGSGGNDVLLYAFPDPGEAVGGTSIVTLIDGLLGEDDFLSSLGVTWHFIPCLNLEDQPDRGRSLQAVYRRPDIREVDWCADNPRPETRALLEYIQAIRPIFTYPLHDEFHCGESLPLYFCMAGDLPTDIYRHLASAAKAFGLAVAHDACDPSVPKVIEMASSPDFPKSTFGCSSQYGPVFIAEVSQQNGASAADLVGAQLAFGMMVLRQILNTRNKGTEPTYAVDEETRATTLTSE